MPNPLLASTSRLIDRSVSESVTEIGLEVTEDTIKSDDCIMADEIIYTSMNLQGVQEAIEEYGRLIQKFQFSKASAYLLKFRSDNLVVLSDPSTIAWSRLLLALADISTSDCGYYTLSFLQKNRSVFRKDQYAVKTMYHNIISNLKEGFNDMVECSTRDPGRFLLDMCMEYVLVRLEMIKFYESMTTLANASIISWSSVKTNLENIRDKLLKCNHPYLSQISHLFLIKEEIEILRLLISAQMHIANCRMFESLLELKEVRERFDFWIKEIGSLKPTSTTFFAKLRGTDPEPVNRVILWLIKFYNLLMAKFSLYFTNVLGAFCGELDLKAIHMIDNSYNFIDSFREVLVKSNAHLVAIVMDRKDQSGEFYGFGYHRLENKFSAGAPMEPLEGLQATCPYVFLVDKNNQNGQKLIMPNDLPEEDPRCYVELFLHKFRDFSRSLSSEDGSWTEKKNLTLYTNPKKSVYVYGDSLEGKLYILAIYDHSLSSMEMNELTKFIHVSQYKLRGSELFHDLKTAVR